MVSVPCPASASLPVCLCSFRFCRCSSVVASNGASIPVDAGLWNARRDICCLMQTPVSAPHCHPPSSAIRSAHGHRLPTPRHEACFVPRQNAFRRPPASALASTSAHARAASAQTRQASKQSDSPGGRQGRPPPQPVPALCRPHRESERPGALLAQLLQQQTATRPNHRGPARLFACPGIRARGRARIGPNVASQGTAIEEALPFFPA